MSPCARESQKNYMQWRDSEELQNVDKQEELQKKLERKAEISKKAELQKVEKIMFDLSKELELLKARRAEAARRSEGLQASLSPRGLSETPTLTCATAPEPVTPTAPAMFSLADEPEAADEQSSMDDWERGFEMALTPRSVERVSIFQWLLSPRSSPTKSESVNV
eukprot:CAMPEP_0194484456 /NCGR_PEP_ID=MMETSP0253-20130528/5769_1 /TAXON_ID=2966 /ORGANISM="Noctiluca scintillans" /LENGTH=164 /DNA_ID=CAMNT_0039324269 /DNA_START=59 /DNA_END=553 /DNA_ORIENTATION=-